MICTILTDGSELNGICRNEEEPPLLMVRSRLFTLMQTLVAQGYDEFWLNGEYGIPLWAAEFLLKLRVGNPITVHIAVPYEEQSTNWTEEIRDRYFAVHEQADEVTMVGKHFTVDCYETADRYMLDRSDALLICGAAGSQPEAAVYAGENQLHVMYANLQA